MGNEMKSKQCIFLLPEADKLPQLQLLRLQYDPLAKLIPPHITVVFPFEVALERAALRLLMEQQGVALPIPFVLDMPRVKDGCLFFPLALGREAVMALTQGLYSALPESLSFVDSNIPHVTFGHLEGGQGAEVAFRDAEQVLPLAGVCRRLILESIGEDGRSCPELEVCCD